MSKTQRKEHLAHYGNLKQNNILISGNELNSAIIKFHISKCKLKRLEENKIKEEANDIKSEQEKQSNKEELELIIKQKENEVNKTDSIISNNSPIKSSILTKQTEEKTEIEDRVDKITNNETGINSREIIENKQNNKEEQQQDNKEVRLNNDRLPISPIESKADNNQVSSSIASKLKDKSILEIDSKQINNDILEVFKKIEAIASVSNDKIKFDRSTKLENKNVKSNKVDRGNKDNNKDNNKNENPINTKEIINENNHKSFNDSEEDNSYYKEDQEKINNNEEEELDNEAYKHKDYFVKKNEQKEKDNTEELLEDNDYDEENVLERGNNYNNEK